MIPDYVMKGLSFLTPPERLTVSEWTARNRRLEARYAARPGLWSNDTTPYLTRIMDTLNDPNVEEVYFVKPTQVGATEAIVNMLLYTVAQDPAPTMVVYPTEDIANKVVKSRIRPAIAGTEAVSALYQEDATQLMQLPFLNMDIYLATANSAASLASVPIGRLFLDEVDKYPKATGKEANPIELARERTKTYDNRKIFVTSTPTLVGGHIWEALQSADAVYHYRVPCPGCGKRIELLFPQLQFFKQSDAESIDERSRNAVYICPECGREITDKDKGAMLRAGDWELAQGSKNGRRIAFHMNTLYSPFVRFSEVARKFLLSKDSPEDLQNFVNSWLAEPWEDLRLRANANSVLSKQTDVPRGVVPDWAQLLTAGVDVQEKCVYLSIRAWGAKMTSQNILHAQLADLSAVALVMEQPFRTSGGTELLVSLCAVDSGDQTDMVYDFCAGYPEWAIPVKGASKAMAHAYFRLTTIDRAGSAAHGRRLLLVDGGRYKSMIAGRMARDLGEGCFMTHAECDEEYAEQMTNEQLVVDKNGNEHWKLKSPKAANHYLDAEVYACAAADLMGVRSLGREEDDEEEVVHRHLDAGGEDYIGQRGDFI